MSSEESVRKGVVARHKNPVEQVGFTQVSNLVIFDQDISGEAFRLYMVIKQFAWTRGFAWPGQKRLGEILGMSERTVRSLLRELENRGLIEIQRCGLTKPNIYWVVDLKRIYGREDVRAFQALREPLTSIENRVVALHSFDGGHARTVAGDTTEAEHHVRATVGIGEHADPRRNIPTGSH